VSASPIQHRLLEQLGIEHGFGVRDAPLRSDVVRPVQVHGSVVASVDLQGGADPEQADAVVTTCSRQCIGIVTADCVPILAASASGRAVAAIHAGWRGLAAGVVEMGLRALALRAPGEQLVAVVGPHIGACCYEVDEPVTSALLQRFGLPATQLALELTRPGHAMLDLARLVDSELEQAGIERAARARVGGCTHCDAGRFHSYRRDGARAGRMLHFLAPM
jgi:YfiH family protein